MNQPGHYRQSRVAQQKIQVSAQRQRIINNRRLLRLVKSGHLMDAQQAAIIREILAESQRTMEKHGEHTHLPNGTGQQYVEKAIIARARCNIRMQNGTATWSDILCEEFWESLSESDPAKLKAELIQVASVAMRWIETLNERPKDENRLKNNGGDKCKSGDDAMLTLQRNGAHV